MNKFLFFYLASAMGLLAQSAAVQQNPTTHVLLSPTASQFYSANPPSISESLTINLTGSSTATGTVTLPGTLTLNLTQGASSVGISNLTASGTPSSSTYLRGDNTWATVTSNPGTVTSVSATVPSYLSISGSPITSSGTLAITGTSTGTGTIVVLSASPTFTGTPIAQNMQFTVGGTTFFTGVGGSNFQISQIGSPFTVPFSIASGAPANSFVLGSTGTLTLGGTVAAPAFVGNLTGTAGAVPLSGVYGFGSGVASTLSGTVNVNGGITTVPPNTFYPSTYGAKGDTRVFYDGIFSSGSATLTSTSGAFTSSDVGKEVVLQTTVTGTASVRQLFTVATVTNSATLTLSGTVGTTLSPTATVYLGTDDTASVQSCINAAFSSGSGIVQFSPSIYMLAGTATGTNTSVLSIPTSTTTGFQEGIELRGAGTYGYCPTNVPTTPPLSGTILYCPNQSVPASTRSVTDAVANGTTLITSATATFTSADVGKRLLFSSLSPVRPGIINTVSSGTNMNILGWNATTATGLTLQIDLCPSIIACAPFNYAGLSGGFGFSGTNLKISNICFRQPAAATLTDIQWYKGGGLEVRDCASDIDIPTLTSSLPNPNKAFGYGIICPSVNNSAWTHIDGYYATGRYEGIEAGEHSDISKIMIDGCFYDVGISKAIHTIAFGRANINRWGYSGIECENVLFPASGGTVNSTVATFGNISMERPNGASFESSWQAGTWDIHDPSLRCEGYISALLVVVSNVGVTSSLNIPLWPQIGDVTNQRATFNQTLNLTGQSNNSGQLPGFAFPAGSTAGNMRCQPFLGGGAFSLKLVVLHLEGMNGSASYTFAPTAFNQTPVAISTSGLSTTLVTSLTTSAVTVTTVTPTTGFIFIMGY